MPVSLLEGEAVSDVEGVVEGVAEAVPDDDGVTLGVRVDVRVRVAERLVDLVGLSNTWSKSLSSNSRESSHASQAAAVRSPNDTQHTSLGSASRNT